MDWNGCYKQVAVLSRFIQMCHCERKHQNSDSLLPVIRTRVSWKINESTWALIKLFQLWCVPFLCVLLAHLSRRLTRWAYSIAMVRRPSVVGVRRRRRPHFQTCISLKPAGQPRSNFMCSITGVGERLHKVLGQIRSKLWFPWKQKAPIDL